MSTKPLEIKNYLSEKLELLSELLNKGEDTLIVSPTDSGKTRAIITYAKQNPQRRIAVLCPTQALVDNLKQDCDMPAGYGKKWAQNTQFFHLLVTTYDSIQFFEENRFDAIFIDEAHYLAQAGIYRVKALEYMMELDCQKILVTATPNVIERLEGFTRVEFVKETKRKEIKIYNQRDNEINIAATLIKNRNPENLLMLRINNKEILDGIHEKYPDLVITKIYSDKEQVIIQGQDEEAFKNIKKGVISKSTQVVLTTSIMDCGISLEVNRDVDCYAISYGNVINPIDAVQLSARVRSNSEFRMHLSIIGHFDDYSTVTFPINQVKGKQRFELMATEYDMLSKLFIYYYIELLNSYNITVDEKKPLVNLVRFNGKNGRSSISIAKNFGASSKYPEIVDLAKNYGYSDWLEVIKGDQSEGYKENTEYVRIFSELIEAIEYGISFKFFIKDKYYRDTLTKLKYCVDNYWKDNSREFKEFIDLLIAGYRGNEKKVSISLKLFSELATQEKDAGKQLAKLMFKSNNKWNSESKTFNNRVVDSDIENFIIIMTDNSRYNVKCLQRKGSNAII
ncbi:DEAD/DEAH box helicase family protein [Flavobacteriaceae bacterium]|nr:DEAD/DEAH box helicase family protein [Flavobacteriaceae bacterium]